MMILKPLLNTEMICKMFIKILKNTIQVLIVFDDIAADMISNKDTKSNSD